MKKILVFIFAAIIAVSMVGCSYETSASSDTTSILNSEISSAVSESFSKPSEKEITNIDYKKLPAAFNQYQFKYVRIAGKVSACGMDTAFGLCLSIKDGLGGGTNQMYVVIEHASRFKQVIMLLLSVK